MVIANGTGIHRGTGMTKTSKTQMLHFQRRFFQGQFFFHKVISCMIANCVSIYINMSKCVCWGWAYNEKRCYKEERKRGTFKQASFKFLVKAPFILHNIYFHLVAYALNMVKACFVMRRLWSASAGDRPNCQLQDRSRCSLQLKSLSDKNILSQIQ